MLLWCNEAGKLANIFLVGVIWSETTVCIIICQTDCYSISQTLEFERLIYHSLKGQSELRHQQVTTHNRMACSIFWGATKQLPDLANNIKKHDWMKLPMVLKFNVTSFIMVAGWLHMKCIFKWLKIGRLLSEYRVRPNKFFWEENGCSAM